MPKHIRVGSRGTHLRLRKQAARVPAGEMTRVGQYYIKRIAGREHKGRERGEMVMVSRAVDKKIPADGASLEIVTFPDAKDVPGFKKALEGVRGCPGIKSPGSIGTFGFILSHPNDETLLKRIFPIGTFAQAHFMREGNPKLRKNDAGLSKELESKYAGWRKHALEMAIEIGRGQGMNLYVSRGTTKGTDIFQNEVMRACSKLGAKHRTIDGVFHYIEPRP